MKKYLLLIAFILMADNAHAAYGGCAFGDCGSGTGGGGSGTVNSGTANQAAYYAADGTAVSGSSVLSIVGSNVGIGSSSPTQVLDVNGNVNTNGYFQSTGTGDSYFSGQNVGMGTFAPVFSQLGISPPTSVWGLSIGSGYATTNTPGQTNGAIVQGNVGIGTNNPSSLFQVGVNKLQVLSAGNVGINSATPGTALDVQGTIRASTGTAGQATCWKADKSLGQCTSVVGAGGACTCS